MADYDMSTTVHGRVADVRPKVVAALKEAGFGVLTTIDMSATLKEKIGADIEPYEILGACNPGLAAQALAADRSIGLLLPCNVVLREVGDAVEVSVLDPEAMFSLASEDTRMRLSALVADAKGRLSGVVAELSKA